MINSYSLNCISWRPRTKADDDSTAKSPHLFPYIPCMCPYGSRIYSPCLDFFSGVYVLIDLVACSMILAGWNLGDCKYEGGGWWLMVCYGEPDVSQKWAEHGGTTSNQEPYTIKYPENSPPEFIQRWKWSSNLQVSTTHGRVYVGGRVRKHQNWQPQPKEEGDYLICDCWNTQFSNPYQRTIMNH